jgi:uncharacterized protein YerC
MKKMKNSQVGQLATLLADIKDPKLMQGFLNSFLSKQELVTMKNRLSIIHMLSMGKSYKDIQDKLSVSSATISTTSQFKDALVLQKVIKKLNLETWAQSVVKKYFNWLIK